ncbi:hypothetical protein AB0C34_17045 [Nocardia sp. NPDC049220]|uniref:hypothetical protein n=1 Tax=Nocardia sp. NPDC049220 TaxID=3155273 RepID=UPI0033ED0338
MTVTAAQIAKAARIAPRTKRFVLRDEYGFAYDGNRTEHVLAAIGSVHHTPDLDQATHIAARALYKCFTTGRMNIQLASDVRQRSPYQLCKMIAHIVNGVGADALLAYSVGPVADYWINEHRDEF